LPKESLLFVTLSLTSVLVNGLPPGSLTKPHMFTVVWEKTVPAINASSRRLIPAFFISPPFFEFKKPSDS
jgi:hypothetical protein